MELSPEERQRIYQEEKARLEVRQQIKDETGMKNRRRVLGCLGIGIGAIIVLAIIGNLSPTRKSGETVKTPVSSVPDLPPEPMLELIDFNWHKEYSYAIVQRQVRNISTQPLRNVAALATFYDKDGGFITSDESLIDLNPILPGQVSPFKVMETENPAMVKAGVEFKHLLGGSIPFQRAKKK